MVRAHEAASGSQCQSTVTRSTAAVERWTPYGGYDPTKRPAAYMYRCITRERERWTERERERWTEREREREREREMCICLWFE